MKKQSFVLAAAFMFIFAAAAAHFAQPRNVSNPQFVPAKVFQAAGPDAASIQGVIDQYRTALGGGNNGNAAGLISAGRREINWDGGGSSATAVVPTPFDGFLNTRGARFSTPGSGFVQATPAGLADVFNNRSYASTFEPFSPLRLFSPIAGNETDTVFFIPGTAGGTPATTKGFGAIFSDVDRPNGNDPDGQNASTSIEYFDSAGNLIFTSLIPSSPGDATFSFFGIVLKDARIARVRITAGAIPGIDDSADVVMMDDFIFGEPQPIQ